MPQLLPQKSLAADAFIPLVVLPFDYQLRLLASSSVKYFFKITERFYNKNLMAEFSRVKLVREYDNLNRRKLVLPFTPGMGAKS